ncbi:MAG TPA: hypothetical protein VF853_01190 [Candidatus Deferrimicrobiaceae bacterium]
MKRCLAVLGAFVFVFLIVPGGCWAETRTISWTAVTTYTDGTPIEPTRTITYDIFWTTDAGLSPATLRAIASSVSQTSATFDPDVQGMPRGQTIYFTGDAVLDTGEKSAMASPYSWVVPTVTPPPAPTLASLSISGPASVNENSGGTFTATATWSDNSQSVVSPTWSVSPATYASISSAGVLSTLTVTSNQAVAVAASYPSGGVTRTATRAVTIVDVPAGTLNPPQNVAVTGPVATSPTRIFRLGWDPVASYADGTPIPAGSARYTAYWTTDSSLSPGTLRPLASSIAGTSVDFDPAAAGMVTDQRVYFTAIVTTTAGEQSPLAPGITWVVLNPGPAAPTGGTIIRR